MRGVWTSWEHATLRMNQRIYSDETLVCTHTSWSHHVFQCPCQWWTWNFRSTNVSIAVEKFAHVSGVCDRVAPAEPQWEPSGLPTTRQLARAVRDRVIETTWEQTQVEGPTAVMSKSFHPSSSFCWDAQTLFFFLPPLHHWKGIFIEFIVTSAWAARNKGTKKHLDIVALWLHWAAGDSNDPSSCRIAWRHTCLD